MSCQKAFEADLAAFLLEPGADEWAEFRNHYAQCRQCSAEVRAWIELDALLRSGKGEDPEAPGAGTAHPPEERLLMFEQRPRSMPAAERESLKQHLSTCRSCADELAALRRFDFTRLELPTPALTLRQRFANLDLGAFARRLVVHPAFAYALVLLLLYPTIREHLPRPSPRQHEEILDTVAEEAVEPMSAARRELEMDHARVRKGAVPERPRALERTDEYEQASRLEGSPSVRTIVPRRESATKTPRVLGAVTPAERWRWPAVTLEADRWVEVLARNLDDGLVIRIPIAHLPAAEIEVRVSDSTKRREVRERFGGGDDHVEMRLPASWLTESTYRIEVRPSEHTGPPGDALATFFLRVR